WASQKERIVVIESKCDGLEKERYKLGEIKIKLREEIDGLKLRCRMLKQDRAEVVSKAGNAYVTAEYPFLVEATRDPSTALEDLLSKKPRSLNPPHSNQEAFTFKPQSSAPITITEKLVSSNCTPEKTTDNA
ncbi:auxilin-like protein, partial [Tanacetum coccineum]